MTSRYQLGLLSFILATMCIRNDIHKRQRALKSNRTKWVRHDKPTRLSQIQLACLKIRNVIEFRAGLLNGRGHEEKETTPVDRNMKYATLEKFLEVERMKDNPSLSESDKNSSKSHKLTIGEGQLVDTIRNKENAISLKSAIKDPSLVQKIGQLEELEDRRQQLYLDILKKRGQIVVAPDGAQTIVSYPKVL